MFFLLHKLSATLAFFALCEYTKLIPTLSRFIASHTWNILPFMGSSSLISSLLKNWILRHLCLWGTWKDRNCISFSPCCPGSDLWFRFDHQDSKWDVWPSEMCEMSRKQAESACNGAVLSAAVLFLCGFRGRCPNVHCLCTCTEAGCGCQSC